MRFTIRDLLWATALAAVLCAIVIQRRQFQGQAAALRKQTVELREQIEDLNSQPRSVTLGYDDTTRELPAEARRAIVDFPPGGGVRVKYGPIPPEYLSKNAAAQNRQKPPATDNAP